MKVLSILLIIFSFGSLIGFSQNSDIKNQRREIPVFYLGETASGGVYSKESDVVTLRRGNFLDPNYLIVRLEMFVDGCYYQSQEAVLSAEMKEALAKLSSGTTIYLSVRVASKKGPAMAMVGEFVIE